VKDTRTPTRQNALGLVAGASDLTELEIASELSTVLASGQETGPNGELALRIYPIVGSGGAQNIRDVLTLPGADLGIAPTILLQQLRQSKNLGDLSRKITYITPLYVQEFHVVAGTEIRSIGDLADKVINLGEDDGIERLARDLFGALHINATFVNISQREALQQIRRGEIAATVLLSGQPIPMLSEYKQEDGLHFLPVTDITALEKGFLPTNLMADSYPNMIIKGEPIPTVGVNSVLFAYNWPSGSNRQRLLTDFVQAFFSRIMEFQKPTRHPKWGEINLFATVPGWPRFAAAERWLDHFARSETTDASLRAEFERALDTTGSIASTPSERDRLYQDFLRWREEKWGLRSGK